MKNNYIFQKNKLVDWHCFKFLQTSTIHAFIKERWILTSALNCLQRIPSVQVYEGNKTSRTFVVGKGGYFNCLFR